MLRDTTRRFFERSGFNEMQAEALADMVAEHDRMITELSSVFATKHDLELLEERLETKMNALEGGLEKKINALESRLTWRFIALTAFLGTFLGLINIFAG